MKIIEIKCCKECPNCIKGTFHDFCKILPYFNDNGKVNHISLEDLDKYAKDCPLKDSP